MKQNNEGPMEDANDERDAIRALIAGTEMEVLTWHGSEPHVALVSGRSAGTEYTVDGERVVLVEWRPGQEYALSVAVGENNRWELEDTIVSTHTDREETINAAQSLFEGADE